MYSAWDEYVQLYPQAQKLKRNKILKEKCQLDTLNDHMDVIEKMWDDINQAKSEVDKKD